ANRAFYIDNSVALVAAVDVDLNRRSKDFRPGTLRQQTMQTRKTVGRDARAPPLNDITISIIVRRLDQDDLEGPLSHTAPQCAGYGRTRPSCAKVASWGSVPDPLSCARNRRCHQQPRSWARARSGRCG